MNYIFIIKEQTNEQTIVYIKHRFKNLFNVGWMAVNKFETSDSNSNSNLKFKVQTPNCAI
jgi:hypothetical protein